MKNFSHRFYFFSRKARTVAALIAATPLVVALALLAASCAAPLKLDKAVAPFALLDPDSDLMLGMDGPSARRFLPYMVSLDQAAALAPIIERTTYAALGISRLADDQKPAGLEAVFFGDYPFRSAAMALGLDPQWRRVPGGFEHRRLGIQAALPGPRILLATNAATLEPITRRARAGGMGDPVPRSLAARASGSLTLWAPDPFRRFFAKLAGASADETPTLPARGFLVDAVESGDGGYLLSIAFVMNNANDARLYRPLFRLLWYSISVSLFESTRLEADFSLDGDCYVASGIRLSAEALASALSRLSESAALER